MHGSRKRTNITSASLWLHRNKKAIRSLVRLSTKGEYHWCEKEDEKSVLESGIFAIHFVPITPCESHWRGRNTKVVREWDYVFIGVTTMLSANYWFADIDDIPDQVFQQMNARLKEELSHFGYEIVPENEIEEKIGVTEGNSYFDFVITTKVAPVFEFNKNACNAIVNYLKHSGFVTYLEEISKDFLPNEE